MIQAGEGERARMRWIGFRIVISLLIAVAAPSHGQSRLPKCPPVDDASWDNCQGTKDYGNGDKYVGEFRAGKPDGYGTLSGPNGKYVGQLKNNRLEGWGTQYNPDGTIVYSGMFVNGQRANTAASAAGTVRMEVSGGVYVVPVRFNDAITLDAVVDSGASDVSIPADVVLTLIRTRTIAEADFLGMRTYVLADGSKVPSQQFRIRTLKVGATTVENITASIAPVNGTILLGQSFLNKFKSWS
jgi:gag-polyprotein putative aspartyl protease/MORN repeat